MPKSFNSSKTLSRLGLRGAVLDTTAATTGKYEGYVPTLGADNKLDPSVIGTGSASFGDVAAENVSFNSPPEQDGAVTNVRDAINNITKDSGGLALMRTKNLTDVEDAESSFNSIKQLATVDDSGSVVGGVVGIASQDDLEDGTDTADDSGTSTLLAASPSTIKTTYLSKLATSAQTMAGAIVLPAAPNADMQAATKKYVDDSVAASFAIPTGATIWVDSVNGSDTTGARGKLNKPVLTLQQAYSLAVAGDLIIVGPGTYNANDLAKDGVHWYFQPGAQISFTGGTYNDRAIFQVAGNESCYVHGYGKFYNAYTSGSSRYVLKVASSGTLIFEGNWVQSMRTAIYADCGEGGYAQITIRDSLVSDSQDFTGDSAAQLASGTCILDVGRRIYSAATAGSSGLRFGSGALTTSAGGQVVRCPQITGKVNAIHFDNTARAQVIADYCTSTDGPAIKVSGGTKNIVTITGQLTTTAVADSVINITGGFLQCINTAIYATNAQPGVYMNNLSYGLATDPYLVLNNCEIWTEGHNAKAIDANSSGYFKIRIIGAVQSDCVEPTAEVTVLGGTWDYVESNHA